MKTNSYWKSILLSCIALTVCLNIVACSKVNRTSTEKTISQVDSLGSIKYSMASPNSQRVACVVQAGNKMRVVVDGKEEKQYDEIRAQSGNILFSPDSKQLAYQARVDGKWLVVVNGNEEKQYARIHEYLRFSPDGKRLAYLAFDGDKSVMVVDGKEDRQYNDYFPHGLQFSPDSQHIVYISNSGENYKGKRYVVLDGTGQKQYDEIRFLRFSPDSKHLIYEAIENNPSRGCTVLDGVEIENSSYLTFSPDGKRATYLTNVNSEKYMMLDGEKKLFSYEYCLDLSINFSPDGKRIAYMVPTINGQSFWVIDGREEKKYATLFVDHRVVFSPDSKRVGYTVAPGPDYPGMNQYVIIDGRKGVSCEDGDIFGLAFSPDSNKVACIIHDGENGKYFLALNNSKQKRYDRVGNFTFSPDSKYIVYPAKESNKWFVVLDKKEGKQYDEIIGNVVFDSAVNFHYVVRNGNGFYLVEERIDVR